MGVPASEVGYTSAMPRREDHEVRKGHVGHWIKKIYSKYESIEYLLKSYNLSKYVRIKECVELRLQPLRFDSVSAE